MLAVMMITVMAHAAGNTPAKKAETKAVSKTAKAETAPASTAPTAVKASTVKTSTKVKTDGTPDMRYKENKVAKTAAGPKKADGTADMRFKANKTSAAKTVKKAETK